MCGAYTGRFFYNQGIWWWIVSSPHKEPNSLVHTFHQKENLWSSFWDTNKQADILDQKQSHLKSLQHTKTTFTSLDTGIVDLECWQQTKCQKELADLSCCSLAVSKTFSDLFGQSETYNLLQRGSVSPTAGLWLSDANVPKWNEWEISTSSE